MASSTSASSLQLRGQPDDGRLGWWRHQAALDLAQVGRFDVDALRHLAEAEAKSVSTSASRALRT
jgi:hypothetical protein